MSLKIGVIVSTTRPTRVGRKVADWFIDQVKNEKDIEFELIDLAELNLPLLDEPLSPLHHKYEKEHTKKWSAMIEPLDGYVIVTAEYNHGYPAPLKNAIDMLYHEWAKKPVSFVGYGGMGGARAIEQLVNVTARVNLVPQASSTVNIVNVWSAFDEQGKLKAEHLDGSVDKLVENLKWWGNVLKAARS